MSNFYHSCARIAYSVDTRLFICSQKIYQSVSSEQGILWKMFCHGMYTGKGNFTKFGYKYAPSASLSPSDWQSYLLLINVHIGLQVNMQMS